MKHSAKDLFQDWYILGVKTEPTQDEFNVLKQNIEEILTVKEKKFWLDMVTLLFEELSLDNVNYLKLVNLFKHNNDKFPVSKHGQLIKVLAACIIAQKIELNDSFISDLLSLSLICSEIKSNAVTIPFWENILKIAKDFWISECERKRKVAATFDLTKTVVPKKINEDVPVQPVSSTYNSGAVTTEVNAAFTVIKSSLSEIRKQTNINIDAQIKIQDNIAKALQTIYTNYNVLSEEMNVLWFIFGAYSNKLNAPFSEIEIEILTVLLAVELSELTQIMPGIGKVENIVNRALSNNKKYKENVKFEDLINSFLANTKLLDQINYLNINTEEFCPCLFALKCLNENREKGEWKIIFKKKGKIPLDKSLEPLVYAKQIYQELMLVKIYEVA